MTKIALVLTLAAAALVGSSCGGGSGGGCAVPKAATDLRVTSNKGGTVTLAWSAIPSAARYLVEAGSASGKNEQLRAPVDVPAYTATDVKAGTYYTRVLGVNACGTGPASNELAVVVP